MFKYIIRDYSDQVLFISKLYDDYQEAEISGIQHRGAMEKINEELLNFEIVEEN